MHDNNIKKSGLRNFKMKTIKLLSSNYNAVSGGFKIFSSKANLFCYYLSPLNCFPLNKNKTKQNNILCTFSFVMFFFHVYSGFDDVLHGFYCYMLYLVFFTNVLLKVKN